MNNKDLKENVDRLRFLTSVRPDMVLHYLSQETVFDVPVLRDLIALGQEYAGMLAEPAAPVKVTANELHIHDTPEVLATEDVNITVHKVHKGGDSSYCDAVRAEHKPTGIAVTSSENKSQHANQHIAMEKLTLIVAAAKKAEASKRTGFKRRHIAKGGENIDEICAKYGMTRQELTDANRGTLGPTGGYIIQGMVLFVKGLVK